MAELRHRAGRALALGCALLASAAIAQPGDDAQRGQAATAQQHHGNGGDRAAAPRGQGGDPHQRWQQLSPDQRQQLQRRQQNFQALPQDEQQRVRQAEQRYRSMDPQQRDELRQRWQNMSEEERERYRQRIRERM